MGAGAKNDAAGKFWLESGFIKGTIHYLRNLTNRYHDKIQPILLKSSVMDALYIGGE